MRSPTGGCMHCGVSTSLSVGAVALLLSACGQEAQVLTLETQIPVLASALVSTTDPEGDAGASQGIGLRGDGYQDIVGATVEVYQTTFLFSMNLATSVPAAPALPAGITLQEWSWNINTAPELPRGFPFSTGSAAPPEFMVFVTWDGSGFAGTLIDRRPLLSAGQAVSTSIPFAIDGATIRAEVGASLLGDPSSFTWVARTNDWPRLGSGSLQTLDRAPDNAPTFWP
jgi:hypothetical protein